MFEKVLILTDFSEHARCISDCITGISGIREIILLHVIEDIRVPMGRETIERLVTSAAEKSLQTERNYLEKLCPDIRVTPVLTISPDIPGTILEIAEKNGVDLIIISAYGMGIKTGMLTGNISTGVLCRISRINVLVIRHKIIETLTGKTFEKFCPMIFSRILCPTDLSLHAERVIALAGTMTGAGEVIILIIVSPDATRSEITQNARTAESQTRAIRQTFAAKEIQSRTIVKTGDPACVIAETADEEDVSVIWISSSEKGCFYDFLLGSTVNDVIMNTKQPVIVICDVD
ncbi:MAG: universal stress protein [Methanoregula sp.]|jgi:nucleotide-binding universal stress UspA family protein|nr:universal stress protein [Methanoregula sp.]